MKKLMKLIAVLTVTVICLTSCSGIFETLKGIDSFPDNLRIDPNNISFDDPRLYSEMIAGLAAPSDSSEGSCEIGPPGINALYGETRIYDADDFSLTFYYGIDEHLASALQDVKNGTYDPSNYSYSIYEYQNDTLQETVFWKYQLTLYSLESDLKHEWYREDVFSDPESYLADCNNQYGIPDEFSDYTHSEEVTSPHELLFKPYLGEGITKGTVYCKAKLLAYPEEGFDENKHTIESSLFWFNYVLVSDKIVIYDYGV